MSGTSDIEREGLGHAGGHLFVILPGETASTRTVKRASIVDWDDTSRWFYVAFDDARDASGAVELEPGTTFQLKGAQPSPGANGSRRHRDRAKPRSR